MRWINFCVAAMVTWGVAGVTRGAEPDAKRRPNIVMILADDLGVGETGCYGQQIIATPHIDQLAADGMRFTQAYAPAPMCSPTRCSFLTGLHQGHAYIRNNKELEPEGQMPLAAGTVTVAELLKRGGYATACIGKWGLGPVGSEGDPLKMGFDYFYGHNCQRVAHNHYTDHVWRNDDRVDLEGNAVDRVHGKQYVPDMMADEAVKWLKSHKEGPFFLYFAPPLPHASLQAPEEDVDKYRPLVKEGEKYPGKPDEYLPCDEPRATYAAMITRLDRHVGEIVAALKDLGLDDNTILIFSSDNGPQVFGGPDAAYFHSTAGLRGLKHDLYEGGIREPLIVRWPGHVKSGTTSAHQAALYDLMPTFLELAALPNAKRTDGLSLLPLLTNSGQQQEHPFLYWEHAGVGGQKAVRQGKWKAVWVGLKKEPAKAGELYDLEKDPNETTDVSKDHPDVMLELTRLRDESHEQSVVKAWNY